jgi:hypothetical protein
MNEDQLAAQFNADSGVCLSCPYGTDTCKTHGCLLPATDTEEV